MSPHLAALSPGAANMTADQLSSTACGTVKARIDYLKKLPLYQAEKPYQMFLPAAEGATDQRTHNLEFESKECTFTDIRSRAYDCTLDTDGFQFHEFPTHLNWTSLQDRSVVESVYFAEIEQVLKNIEGGYDKIFIFDWRVTAPSSTAIASVVC